MSVLVFHHCRAGIATGSSNDQLAHLVEIGRRHRLGVGQFARKYGRYPNFIGLYVHIWGDNRPSSIVDTFSLECR